MLGLGLVTQVLGLGLGIGLDSVGRLGVIMLYTPASITYTTALQV